MIICLSIFYGNIMFLMIIIYKDSAFCNLGWSIFPIYRSVSTAVGYVFLLESDILGQSSYTYSNLITIWWSGPGRYLCQDLMASGCRKSKKITEVIMRKFNQSKSPKQVLFRSYVFVLGDNSFSTTGTGTWNTSMSKRYSIQLRLRSIPRSHIY